MGKVLLATAVSALNYRRIRRIKVPGLIGKPIRRLHVLSRVRHLL